MTGVPIYGIFLVVLIILQLRYLQTLIEISTEKNSTIIFPLPIELMRAITYRKEV